VPVKIQFGILSLFFAFVLMGATSPAQKVQVEKKTLQSPEIGKQVYQGQCRFCHQPKPVNSLPDLNAWVRLLYTSGCPRISLSLNELQRKQIRAFVEFELKKVPPSPLK